MFNFKPSNTRQPIDDTIDELLEDMKGLVADDEAYGVAMNRLERLYAIKQQNARQRVSPDTMAIVAGNLAGIILIVGHERAHMVTSRALDFVKKTVR